MRYKAEMYKSKFQEAIANRYNDDRFDDDFDLYEGTLEKYNRVGTLDGEYGFGVEVTPRMTTSRYLAVVKSRRERARVKSVEDFFSTSLFFPPKITFVPYKKGVGKGQGDESSVFANPSLMDKILDFMSLENLLVLSRMNKFFQKNVYSYICRRGHIKSYINSNSLVAKCKSNIAFAMNLSLTKKEEKVLYGDIWKMLSSVCAAGIPLVYNAPDLDIPNVGDTYIPLDWTFFKMTRERHFRLFSIICWKFISREQKKKIEASLTDEDAELFDFLNDFDGIRTVHKLLEFKLYGL